MPVMSPQLGNIEELEEDDEGGVVVVGPPLPAGGDVLDETTAFWYVVQTV